jgi:hypothetical protein
LDYNLKNVLCELDKILSDLKSVHNDFNLQDFFLGLLDILREERALALISKEEWNSIATSGQIIQVSLKRKLEVKTRRLWQDYEVKEIENILEAYYEKHYRKSIPLETKLEMLAKPRKCFFRDKPWAKPCETHERLTLHHIIPVRYGGGETSRPELVWMCEFHNKHLKESRQIYIRSFQHTKKLKK